MPYSFSLLVYFDANEKFRPLNIIIGLRSFFLKSNFLCSGNNSEQLKILSASSFVLAKINKLLFLSILVLLTDANVILSICLSNSIGSFLVNDALFLAKIMIGAVLSLFNSGEDGGETILDLFF